MIHWLSTHARTYTRTQTHTYMYTHTHTQTHAHKHTHTHTNTYTDELCSTCTVLTLHVRYTQLIYVVNKGSIECKKGTDIEREGQTDWWSTLMKTSGSHS